MPVHDAGARGLRDDDSEIPAGGVVRARALADLDERHLRDTCDDDLRAALGCADEHDRRGNSQAVVLILTEAVEKATVCGRCGHVDGHVGVLPRASRQIALGVEARRLFELPGPGSLLYFISGRGNPHAMILARSSDGAPSFERDPGRPPCAACGEVVARPPRAA